MLESLKSLVTHNFGLKALALFAACGLWFNIASEPELATIVSVPVDYRNFPKDLVISSPTVNSISIEARGPASRLREMQASPAGAVIDFSSVHNPGERTFTITSEQIRPPRGVSVVRTIPEQLRFRFEHATTRKLPVEISYSGALPHGVSLGKVSVEPSALEITGPESRVIEARRIQTDPFDLSRVTQDSNQELSVYLSDPELRFAEPAHVTVRVQLEHNRTQ